MCERGTHGTVLWPTLLTGMRLVTVDALCETRRASCARAACYRPAAQNAEHGTTRHGTKEASLCSNRPTGGSGVDERRGPLDGWLSPPSYLESWLRCRCVELRVQSVQSNQALSAMRMPSCFSPTLRHALPTMTIVAFLDLGIYRYQYLAATCRPAATVTCQSDGQRRQHARQAWTRRRAERGSLWLLCQADDGRWHGEPER